MLVARQAFVLTLCAIALAATPLVAAQVTSATLLLDRAAVAPGETIVATFVESSPVPLDAAFQDHVTCVIAGPEGETAACDLRGDIVAIRVRSETTYTIPLAAPIVEGDFEVRVTRAPFADTAAMAATAAAALSVAAPEPLALANETADPTTEPEPAQTVPVTDENNAWTIIFGSRDGNPAPPASEDDAARWVVSSSAGTATLVVLLVGSRFGGRP